MITTNSLAAIATGQVRRADILAQPATKLTQHIISRRVAVEVVDLLEVIDVAQQDRHQIPAHVGPLQQALQLNAHIPPIM